MLRDKDIAGVLREMASRITRWHFASLQGPRAAPARDLERLLRETGCATPAFLHESPGEAFRILALSYTLKAADELAHQQLVAGLFRSSAFTPANEGALDRRAGCARHPSGHGRRCVDQSRLERS
jgi:hypothetical protein